MDDNNKNSSNSRKTKLLVGGSAIVVIGAILIVYIYNISWFLGLVKEITPKGKKKNRLTP